MLAHFPELKISKEKSTLMFEFLSDLSPAQFTAAIKRFCLTHKEIYPNTNLIAYLREYALADKLSFVSSGEAWELVLDEIRKRCGAYGEPKIGNPLVQRAVECVGWKDICLSEKPDVVRAHFVKIYENLVEREKLSRTSGQMDQQLLLEN